MSLSLIRQGALLVVLAFVPAIGQAVYFRDKAPWQSRTSASDLVSVDAARSWGANVIWVDARPDEDFARDHVPGAVSLNEDRWDELFPQFFPMWSADKRVVVYCSTQSCNLADEVAKRLRNQTQPPMQHVYVLQGGWEEWLKSKR